MIFVAVIFAATRSSNAKEKGAALRVLIGTWQYRLALMVASAPLQVASEVE
jgi:hypothetical protein